MFPVKNNTATLLQKLIAAEVAVAGIATHRCEGRVTSMSGLILELNDFPSNLSVGEILFIECGNSYIYRIKVIGFRGAIYQAASFSKLNNIIVGANIYTTFNCILYMNCAFDNFICDDLIGRVIDPLGNFLDNKGPLLRVHRPFKSRHHPPCPTERARLGARLTTGVKVIDVFAPCRMGQRLGLFAGSGVGKTTLISMISRNAKCDIVILSIIGERSLEVRNFIEDVRENKRLNKYVLVASTSDQTPLMQIEAAYTAMNIAEYFSENGFNVLLLMDSITRFCLAYRELRVSIGEPPAMRGYPPSVFSELSHLLERAGPGMEGEQSSGQITGIFTVLVEGDDHNEPIADAVRGILDGHIVLDRKIAEIGRYPAVDIIRSLSRNSHESLTKEELNIVSQCRKHINTYNELKEVNMISGHSGDTKFTNLRKFISDIDYIVDQKNEFVDNNYNVFDELNSILNNYNEANFK